MSSLEGLHDGDDRGSLGPVALPAADLEGGTRGGRPAGPRCSADRPSSPWTNPPAAGRPHAQPRSRAWSLLQASGQYPGGNDVIKQGLRDRLPVAPLDTTSQGKVRTLTASRPRSPRTRGTWSLEDGSIKRASTICSKARSPRPPRPAPGPVQDLPQQSQALGLHVVPPRPVRPVTVLGTPGPAAPGPARQQSSAAQPPSGRPARPRRGQSPRCSTIRRTPFSLTAICTAMVPEAVLTLRRNGLTPAHHTAS